MTSRTFSALHGDKTTPRWAVLASGHRIGARGYLPAAYIVTSRMGRPQSGDSSRSRRPKAARLFRLSGVGSPQSSAFVFSACLLVAGALLVATGGHHSTRGEFSPPELPSNGRLGRHGRARHSCLRESSAAFTVTTPRPSAPPSPENLAVPSSRLFVLSRCCCPKGWLALLDRFAARRQIMKNMSNWRETGGGSGCRFRQPTRPSPNRFDYPAMPDLSTSRT